MSPRDVTFDTLLTSVVQNLKLHVWSRLGRHECEAPLSVQSVSLHPIGGRQANGNIRADEDVACVQGQRHRNAPELQRKDVLSSSEFYAYLRRRFEE